MSTKIVDVKFSRFHLCYFQTLSAESTPSSDDSNLFDEGLNLSDNASKLPGAQSNNVTTTTTTTTSTTTTTTTTTSTTTTTTTTTATTTTSTTTTTTTTTVVHVYCHQWQQMTNPIINTVVGGYRSFQNTDFSQEPIFQNFSGLVASTNNSDITVLEDEATGWFHIGLLKVTSDGGQYRGFWNEQLELVGALNTNVVLSAVRTQGGTES